MRERERMGEFHGRITSLKVLPFDDGSTETRYEVTQLIQFSGRLTASGFGSNYVRMAADGTSVTKFYGILTGPDGESIRAEFGGNAVSLGGGKARFRTTGMFRTAAPSLAWLNAQSFAFEGQGDFSTMEISGDVYFWS